MVLIFQTIDNFRDLSGHDRCSHLNCNPCELFRSATLDYASEEELIKLVNDLNVRTILDLRSELEAKLSEQGKPFATFPVAATLKLKPKDMLTPASSSGPDTKVKPINKSGTRKTIMINFAGKMFRKNAVWKAAPASVKLQIVWLMMKRQKHKAVQLVGERVLSKNGLAGLYRNFIDYCGQEIKEALLVLANPDNYPILVHCTQGKDRTGLVSAFALASVGVPEEQIIEDYVLSQKGLERVHEHMVAEMANDGLDPSFADAPPEVMRGTFEYIRTKYGGVEEYLDVIGFTKASRQRLKDILYSRTRFHMTDEQHDHASHDQDSASQNSNSPPSAAHAEANAQNTDHQGMALQEEEEEKPHPAQRFNGATQMEITAAAAV